MTVGFEEKVTAAIKSLDSVALSDDPNLVDKTHKEIMLAFGDGDACVAGFCLIIANTSIPADVRGTAAKLMASCAPRLVRIGLLEGLADFGRAEHSIHMTISDCDDLVARRREYGRK